MSHSCAILRCYACATCDACCGASCKCLCRYGKASPPPPKVLKMIAPAGQNVRLAVEVRVDPDDPDDPDAPILCYTVYNDRHNDVNVKLTITPDVDGCCNHHQPDVNPIEFRVNSMRYVMTRLMRGYCALTSCWVAFPGMPLAFRAAKSTPRRSLCTVDSSTLGLAFLLMTPRRLCAVCLDPLLMMPTRTMTALMKSQALFTRCVATCTECRPCSAHHPFLQASDSDNDSTSPANGDDATPGDHTPSTGDAEINCPVCTFLNPADAHHCQMCFSELTS